ncbi:OmpP1/FadL family transporter [Legionella adelaidensis]|uniref:OmpP1/FadL family transporter n=1 Tax=Legionella adelaidensis TaxID=45056 RepID=UPI0007309832|nr:outer membrane protein transport protein [Legionella adelaidensis]
MKNNKKPIKTALSSFLTVLMANNLHAGGFSLYTEASTTAVGNFAAGSAAEAIDASTGWYNPAGLTLLTKKQVLLSGVGVIPSSKISGVSTFETAGLPSYIQTFSDLQGGKRAIVPALHVAVPFNDRLVGGLSVVSPFGLSTDYPVNSPVRYAATLTQLITANLSPELGYKINENVSIGGGLDLQWAKVKFNAMVGIPTIPGQNPMAFDSQSYNQGDSFAMGFHAGILTHFNQDHTRVGINYQSKTTHKFNGYSQLTGPLADPFLDDPNAIFRSEILSSNKVELPEVITLSGYQDISNRVALLGSVVYTGWNVFKETQLNNVAAFSIAGPTVLDITTPQDYRNAWRFAVGANYLVNEQWQLRVGGGYDQTPTVDAERDVRLPDANRWALSAGAHYQMTSALGFDVGYTYLFAADDSTFDKTQVFDENNAYTVAGSSKVHAHLVGLQGVWTIE